MRSLDELSPRDAVRVALHLQERVAEATPRKTKTAVKDARPLTAAWLEAEQRLEVFLEAIDPGNGARPAVREREQAEAIAQAFGF